MTSADPANLREALASITESLEWGAEAHPAKVAALQTTWPHGIEALTTSPTELDYNCVAFATGLQPHSSRYQEIIEAAGLRRSTKPDWPDRFFANTRFVSHLIAAAPLNRLEASSEPGWIVYLAGDQVKHIGCVLPDERVRSKWGMGFIWEHDTWEVPASYGDRVQYFSPLPWQAVERHFLHFLAQQAEYPEFASFAQSIGIAVTA